MQNSLVASVLKFSNGVLVIRVMGDLDIDIELIARQNGAADVQTRRIGSEQSPLAKATELDIVVEKPTLLLLQIHEYLNSIGYLLQDDVLGTQPTS